MEYNFQRKSSPIQDYNHLDDHIPATHEMNSAFKLFIDYEVVPIFPQGKHAWGDFQARSRFAHSTNPEEK